MKERVSATIDPQTRKILSEILRKHGYRNISHVIEEAIIQLYEGGGKKNEK